MKLSAESELQKNLRDSSNIHMARLCIAALYSNLTAVFFTSSVILKESAVSEDLDKPVNYDPKDVPLLSSYKFVTVCECYQIQRLCNFVVCW